MIPVYFGDAAQRTFLKKNLLWTTRIEEVPVRGGFTNKTPAAEVVFADNVRDIELKFEKRGNNKHRRILLESKKLTCT